MKIAVLGAGYVGLNTAAALAYLGHQVLVIDKDTARIHGLDHGCNPLHEPGLDNLLATCKDRLIFSTNTTAVADADIIFIAVGTPAAQNGEAHIGFVEDAAREVAGELHPHHTPTLVVKSTVPIGTGRRGCADAGHALAQVSQTGSGANCPKHTQASADGCTEFLYCVGATKK